MQEFAPKHANRPPGPCPSDEDLAAYIDGTLDKAESARITEHLASCEDCYAIYMETLHFQLREEGEEVAAASVVELRRPGKGRPAEVAQKSGAAGGSRRSPARWLPLAALLLVGVGGSYFTYFQFLAPPKLATTPAIPPIASLPPVEPGESPLWLGPTNRGVGDHEEIKVDEASFRMGVQIVNLQATLQAGQVKESQDVIARIWNLLDSQPFTNELKTKYTKITTDVEKRPPAELLPEAARLAQEYRGDFDDTTSLDLGQWVEAGRLAAMARNPSFFQQFDNRTFLRRVLWNDKLGFHEVKLDLATRASLDRVSEVLSRRDLRPSDYAELEDQLGKILEQHYPKS